MKLLRVRRKKDGERGQSLVEFVLVVPVFLMLVFAIVDFGIGFHAWISVTNGSREGARLGAVGTNSFDIEDAVRAKTANLDQDKLTVVVTNAEGAPGEPVSVEVEYELEYITPLGGLLDFVGGGAISDSVLLSSTTEMRLE